MDQPPFRARDAGAPEGVVALSRECRPGGHAPGRTLIVGALTAALALRALSAQPASSASSAPPDLDRVVMRALSTFRVPGLALAIVKDGRVVVARGYGVKKLGAAAPVDARTRFQIASNTKAFTAVALALLVEDGKIEWDAPVTRYLPGFAMHDAFVTRELTVRDLLVHRSGLGLGAGDLLWWPPTTYQRRELVARLRHIPLATSFRTAYAYDNVLYAVAGELIETVSGQSWEDFVATRIVARVGMTDTDVRFSTGGKSANVATPHADVEGTVRPVAAFETDNANPAAGIHSTAQDMAKWMIVLLDSGRLADDTRLFRSRTMRELWSMVTPQAVADPSPELPHLRSNFRGYALGFNVFDSRGRKIVQHSGGMPGFLSLVTMVPELRLGIAILTNQESGAAYAALTNHILDHYLAQRPFDYVDAYRRREARLAAATDSVVRRAAAARDSTSRPSLPLARYAGAYADPWYGEVVITLENDRLVLRFSRTPSLVADLRHWQHDTFVARWRDRELRADAFITFALNPDGTIDQAKMVPVSPATDFSFDFQDLLLKPVKR